MRIYINFLLTYILFSAPFTKKFEAMENMNLTISLFLMETRPKRSQAESLATNGNRHRAPCLVDRWSDGSVDHRRCATACACPTAPPATIAKNTHPYIYLYTYICTYANVVPTYKATKSDAEMHCTKRNQSFVVIVNWLMRVA